jgi:hypothetical protein
LPRLGARDYFAKWKISRTYSLRATVPGLNRDHARGCISPLRGRLSIRVAIIRWRCDRPAHAQGGPSSDVWLPYLQLCNDATRACGMFQSITAINFPIGLEQVVIGWELLLVPQSGNGFPSTGRSQKFRLHKYFDRASPRDRLDIVSLCQLIITTGRRNVL